jgi:TRAP-type mannitol/chloroaromatic compound transport system permease large subunit
MNYFDELESKKTEEQEKKLFEEKYIKQQQQTKKVVTLTFGLIALIFIVIGIVFVSLGVVDEEDGFPVGWVFIGLGALYGLIALIFQFIKPQPNYEKFKARVSKYGAVNVYDLSLRIDFLEEKIKKLEEKINEKN